MICFDLLVGLLLTGGCELSDQPDPQQYYVEACEIDCLGSQTYEIAFNRSYKVRKQLWFDLWFWRQHKVDRRIKEQIESVASKYNVPFI